MRLKLGAFFVLLLLALPAPAQAQAQPQPQPRILEVPAAAAWQHARTGLILSPTIAGLTRTGIRDLGNDELDVVAGYENRDEGVVVTVYLYETGAPDVPLWFDRALTGILARPEYGLAGTPPPSPAAFARPGAAAASGLRAALDLAAPGTGSTALAIAPLGSFHLKIRITAARLDRAALDERLTRFIAGVRWPAEAARPAPAAVPVEPCPAPLQLRNARLLHTDVGDALMGALTGIELTDEAGNHPPPPVYCREPGATADWGVYRPNAATNAYLIALNDAGIAYSLAEQLDLGALTGEGSSGRRFALVLLVRDTSGVVAAFNRPPPPEQAMAVARRTSPTILISTNPPAR